MAYRSRSGPKTPISASDRREMSALSVAAAAAVALVVALLFDGRSAAAARRGCCRAGWAAARACVRACVRVCAAGAACLAGTATTRCGAWRAGCTAATRCRWG
jgi:hypothetical protein